MPLLNLAYTLSITLLIEILEFFTYQLNIKLIPMVEVDKSSMSYSTYSLFKTYKLHISCQG